MVPMIERPMRLNPNPRLEKLKDFRHRHYLVGHVYHATPHTRKRANNQRERTQRREWRDHCWDFEQMFNHATRFSHRHSALWDLY